MDRDLVDRAQAGDAAAFEQLALASHARLQRTAVGILRDPHLAEDALQAALLAIWRDLASLRDPTRYEAWSYRILVRACYAEARRAQAHTYDINEVDHPTAGDHADDVQFRDELERAFRHLTLDQRSVLVLHYLVDLTSEQVAEVLDIRVGTVKSRLGRALARMREVMATDAASPQIEAPDSIQQEAIR